MHIRKKSCTFVRFFDLIKNNNDNNMRFIGIIPARYASTRFPGKPLADIGGKPMIQRVYEQAKKALSTVVVATDDERIYNTVLQFGGEAVMTSPACKCGTERCQEVASQLGLTKDDVVINIQGDEPFIQPSQIEAIQSCFPTEIATLVKPFAEGEDITNVNTPKVVINRHHYAMYFSRSVIPYTRCEPTTMYKHIGMYAYRADILNEIVQLEQTPLEKAESLEQLRWLENGYPIKVAISNTYSIGIDTPEDLERARQFLSKQ